MPRPLTPLVPIGRTAVTILLLAAVGCGVQSADGSQSEGARSEDRSSDAIAWEAHIGGFVAGLMLLPVLDRAR